MLIENCFFILVFIVSLFMIKENKHVEDLLYFNSFFSQPDPSVVLNIYYINIIMFMLPVQ